MKNKKSLKIGILFGIVGFILTLLFAYLATGTFDLRFPAVIGIGFFGGGFLGSQLRRLYKTGEERKANLIMVIIIGLLMISQIYSLATGQIRGPMWRMIITTTTIIGCVIVGYFILSSLMKSGKKTKMKKWKKGAMLGALIGGGWTILGGVVTLIIASTGSAPQFSWKFLISSFPLYTLFVPLGLVDWGQRLAPPGLCNFLLFPVVALYWAAIGAFIGYLIDKHRR